MQIRACHYHRKDGRWEGYVIYTDPDTEEEEKKSFYCNSPYGKDSKSKMNKFAEKLEEGDFSEIRNVTIEAWLKKYIAVYCANREQITLDGYNRYIDKHINLFLGKKKLKELRPMHIQEFYNDERAIDEKTGKAKYSEKTILQEHRILSRAFKKAVADGMMSRNPCEGVDVPSPEDFKAIVYSEEEFSLLLEKLEGHRMEAIILLAGMCGIKTWRAFGINMG